MNKFVLTTVVFIAIFMGQLPSSLGNPQGRRGLENSAGNMGGKRSAEPNPQWQRGLENLGDDGHNLGKTLSDLFESCITANIESLKSEGVLSALQAENAYTEFYKAHKVKEDTSGADEDEIDDEVEKLALQQLIASISNNESDNDDNTELEDETIDLFDFENLGDDGHTLGTQGQGSGV